MYEVWSRAADVLYECEALASLRHTYLGSFSLDPEDIISQRLGGNLELKERNRAPMTWHHIMGHKVPAKKACMHWDQKGLNPYTILFYSILG